MNLSPSVKATLKRFAWLWGALLGAVLLPMLMEACSCAVAIYLPHPKIITSAATTSFFAILRALLSATRHYGLLGAALGCCGVMLWTDKRSLWWRVLSALVATGTLSYQSWDLWNSWHSVSFGSADVDRWVRCVTAAHYAPLLLTSFLLLFFALILRSSRASAS